MITQAGKGNRVLIFNTNRCNGFANRRSGATGTIGPALTGAHRHPGHGGLLPLWISFARERNAMRGAPVTERVEVDGASTAAPKAPVTG